MKGYLLLLWCILFCLIAAASSADDIPEAECCVDNCQFCYHPVRLSLSGYVGEGMGHDTRRASASFFYSQPVKSIHPFLDLRAHYLSHHRWASNAGLGVRWEDACANRIWGANLYYDYREHRVGDFNQVGVGLESLGSCFDFRFNFYYPVGKKKQSHTKVFNDFIGPFEMTCREKVIAKRGASAEFGLPLYRCGCMQLYTALGAYYYRYKHIVNFWGGIARVAFRYTEYLSIEAKVTYDKDFHTKAQGIFTLTLPFSLFTDCGCSESNCLLWQPVVRNDVIILNSGCCWSQNF